MLRGGAKWDLVLDLIATTRRGKSRVLLVEGEPGSGKSVFLAAAADAAGAEGFCLVSAAADELSRFTPLTPLLTALPASYPDPGAAEGSEAGTPLWLTANIRAQLEELASVGPVLASFDDLHWADPATLSSLRALPRRLAPYPLSWILARGTHGGSQEAELLFKILEQEGAARIRLPPLTDEAQAALMTDVLGATPDASLREFAASASGNPFLLTELLRGLRDEGAVMIADDRASLIAPRIPHRFQCTVQDRVGGLAPRTRQLLETGAVLGQSFRLEDVAAMLGDSPGALLAAVEEALAAQFVVATADAIAFEHELVWRAVAETLPLPVRQALHQQFGEMLLARGGSAVAAAHHLLAGARPGDPVVLSGLDRATEEALGSAPHTAAELAVRVLELTTPADQMRPTRTVTAVKALTVAGQWEQATTLAESALVVPIPSAEGAQLRSALSSLQVVSDRPAEALMVAEDLLADQELPGDVLDEARVAMLQALTALRYNRRAAELARVVLARPGARGSEVVIAALLALALVAWDAGQVAEALDLATEAVRTEGSSPSSGRRSHPYLFLASRLVDIHNFADAEAIMNMVDRVPVPDPISWSPVSPDVLRARMALFTGHLDEAAAEANSALGRDGVLGARPHQSIALSILATVALRQGDLHAAARHVDRSPASVRHFVPSYETSWNTLVAAQVVEARNGPRAALDGLAGVFADLHEHRYLLMTDPASAAWLVRTALAAGDQDPAEKAAAAAAELCCTNRDVPLFQASAEHARGVLDANRRRLEQAAALHVDPWAQASAAEDLAVVLIATGPADEAVPSLDSALDGYASTGADRDAARIRRRLRRLGVRRRHWAAAANRPPTGWDSLTSTEHKTAELVAKGLTNHQVADQLFISVHTVAYHLRQVFRKLGIRSRVELARIVLQQSAGAS